MSRITLAAVAVVIALAAVTMTAGIPFRILRSDRTAPATAASARSTRTAAAARADARSRPTRSRVQQLDPLPDAACTDGMAGPYPVPRHRPDGVSAARRDRRRQRQRHLGMDRSGDRPRVRAGRPLDRHRVRRHLEPEPAGLCRQPADQHRSSTWRGIKVFANHAFIVSEAVNHGMQVFDLTQLRDVTSPPVTFTETAHYAGFGSTHTLAINTRTGFAYAAGTRTCEGGLHVVDVRTPASPRAAGCFSLDGYTHETQCVVYDGPDTLYRDREICFNSNEDTLTIVDATDKLEQVQLSRTGYGGSAYTHQGWLTEDQRFFLVNDEGDEPAFRHPTRTWIWDVSDLDAPVLASLYDGPTPSIDHNLYVRGNLVYESNYRSGLRVLDASDIAQGALREVGFFDIYPADDAAGLQRRLDVVSVLRQRIGGRQRHRAGPVRRPAARRRLEVSRPASRVTIAARATPRRRSGVVVRRDGRQPRARAVCRRRA